MDRPITRSIPAFITIVGIGQNGESFSAVSRLVEGRFPKYQDIVPATSERELTFPAADLLSAINLAMVATSEETRGVDFEIPDVTGDTGIVSITGKNPNGQKSSGKAHQDGEVESRSVR